MKSLSIIDPIRKVKGSSMYSWLRYRIFKFYNSIDTDSRVVRKIDRYLSKLNNEII